MAKLSPFIIWILTSILLIAIFFIFIIDSDQAEQAQNGVFHASYIENKLPVALNGEWEYYDYQFLFPSDFTAASSAKSLPEYRTLPGNLPSSYGFGTYRLSFTFLGTPTLYSLRLTGVQGAARIYIDGVLLSDIGFTSSLKASSEASKDNRYIVFPLNVMRRNHEIIIHLSNFSNYRSGITSPIYFGTQIDGYRLSSQLKFAESVGLMSVGILAILLVFILIFRIQMGNIFYLLLFTIILFFHLIYFSNDLLTQPIHSWLYLLLSRLYVASLGFIGFFTILLADLKLYKPVLLSKGWKLHRFIFPFLIFITLFCPNRLLPPMNILMGIYLILCFLHAALVLIMRIWAKSYSALMQILALTFLSGYFSLQYFNSQGRVTAVAYSNSYIFLLVAYVAAQLAYVALKVSRIYAGNARLAHRMVTTDKLKSEFISAASHELRTPLHGIINMIESAYTKLKQPEHAREELHLALTIAQKMNSVIHDLYGFYSSSEQLNFIPKPVNLDIEVNAVLEVFRYTSNNSRLSLNNCLSPDAVWVNADESKIWEILNNLIGNSVKYTETGTITITSKRVKHQIYVSVTDTGIGMPFTDNHIFDKSVRLHNARDKSQGIGYGLYLIRQLIEQMNGSIFVEWTKPGQGTCITFCLEAGDIPLPPQQAATFARSDMPSGVLQNYLEDFHGTSATLLVVDDNKDNLNIIRTIFEDVSFSIHCVQSAAKALELLNLNTYDIIILDVMMPEMNGFEMCQIIRKRYSHFELPVLLLTACNSTEEILTGFWSGANDYVVKPADKIELRTRVFSLITLRQSVQSALDNEMMFLQAQIRPHFLYNAFNTISAIALTDGLQASSLIDDLACYLRGCFGNSQDLVSIEAELGIVNSYVRIELARFGQRLEFVSEIFTGQSFFLPPLTIQPLVENAIRHATLENQNNIRIELCITESDQFIHITLQDNGHGIEPDKVADLLYGEPNDKNSGIGLRNVNKRLKLHYAMPLEIQTSPETGTRILIKIPRHL